MCWTTQHFCFIQFFFIDVSFSNVLWSYTNCKLKRDKRWVVLLCTIVWWKERKERWINNMHIHRSHIVHTHTDTYINYQTKCNMWIISFFFLSVFRFRNQIHKHSVSGTGLIYGWQSIFWYLEKQQQKRNSVEILILLLFFLLAIFILNGNLSV